MRNRVVAHCVGAALRRGPLYATLLAQLLVVDALLPRVVALRRIRCRSSEGQTAT